MVRGRKVNGRSSSKTEIETKGDSKLNSAFSLPVFFTKVTTHDSSKKGFKIEKSVLPTYLCE